MALAGGCEECMGSKIASLLNRRTKTHKFALSKISYANFDGLLGITRTQKSFVRSHARFRGLLMK
jgi:hypothetical protein